MGIQVEGVSKRFGSFTALNEVSVDIETGSLVALLGPSGSGKSTLLRLIAGLEQPDNGKIFLTGRDATHESVQDRQVGFVFQHYALFKHLTIRQNIAFGLEISKWSKKRIKHRVDELLELVQLSGLGDRYPSQLSGGQRQRVALARSLALEPQVLLLDEPFGALDAKVRKDLRSWLRRLHNEVHVTTVFVTHDQEEAMEVADKLVVMSQGKVEQVGSPAEIYDHPATPFVMGFIGPVNVLSRTAPIFRGIDMATDHTEVFVRPHDVVVATTPDPRTTLATVSQLIHLGWEVQAEFILEDGQPVTAHLSREQFDRLRLQPQQQVFIKPKEVKAFADDYSASGHGRFNYADADLVYKLTA
jgi:sulfate/thiosulfate transport system ATP-binding protein